MRSLCAKLLVAASLPLLLSTAQAATQDLGNGFYDHGMAAPSSNRAGVVATVDGEGRNVVLIWLADHRGAYALLVVDAENGKSEQIPVPTRQCALNSLFSSNGKLYTHLNTGRFVEFDPLKRAFTFSLEAPPQLVTGMTEDDNGVIWASTLPNCGVLSLNPKTREVKDYGSAYPQNWRQYPTHVAADDAGWIYIGTGLYASQIVAFDPKTGTGKPMLPQTERGKGIAYVYRDLNGRVYGFPVPGATDGWYEFYRGEGKKIGKLEQRRQKPISAGHPRTIIHDRFPDGNRLVSCDVKNRVLVIEDPKTRESRQVRFDYSTDGAYIFGVAASPDGTLCGNAHDEKPRRTFFSYNPKTDQWVRQPSFAQWNTMARQSDRFFVGTYPMGSLLEWDPSRPWVDTVKGKEGCNPRILMEAVPVIGRPHDLLAYPDGKTIIMAGTPGYGYRGGGLLFWDREKATGTLVPHMDILPEHSTHTLVALPGSKLLGGTTTNPGSGEKLAEVAELYVMDVATKRLEWHQAVLPGAQQITDMCLGPDGLAYAVADKKRFFVFDLARKKVVHDEDLTSTVGQAIWHQGPRIFVPGPKGAIYMLLVKGIARVEPSTFRIALLAKSPVPVGCGGDIVGGRIYFTSGSHLYSYRLPE